MKRQISISLIVAIIMVLSTACSTAPQRNDQSIQQNIETTPVNTDPFEKVNRSSVKDFALIVAFSAINRFRNDL